MNLFACEDNVFQWSQTDPASGDGIRPLEDWAAVFSTNLFKRRLDADYLSRMSEYRGEMGRALAEAYPAFATYRPIEGGDHNAIVSDNLAAIRAAMTGEKEVDPDPPAD